MKLSDIFSQLTYGELSQVSVGSADQGVIDATNYNQVLAHINLALAALYKRFPLKEGRASFALKPGQPIYKITTEDGLSFLQGSNADEFADDIIKIEKVLTDAGFELGINNSADVYSCFTPSATTLRVASPITDQIMDLPPYLKTVNLTVVYRANHPIISLGRGTFNPALVDVELPYSHLEALLMFVASRVHNPIGMDHGFHAGNSYYAKYESICQQLEKTNVGVDQGSQSTRLRSNGWV